MSFAGRLLLAAALAVVAPGAAAAAAPPAGHAKPAHACLKRSRLGRCERWSRAARRAAPSATHDARPRGR
ncbi:hypothetical protein [Luteimonas aquatica]|uniref:hypothetical protein n=1 Tax=Luteimonas aquatica TaxID=450364 RepID=UPI001F5978D7|nr:hypothetical protein [Luteimonas aquatica]